MDLKNRLMSFDLEESTVARILPTLSPEEAAKLYDSSDDEIKKAIPDLLEKVVNNVDPHELDLEKIGLIQPGGGDTVKSIPHQALESVGNNIPTGVPTLLNSPKNSIENNKPYLKILLFIIFTIGLFFIFSGMKKKETEEVVNESEKINEVHKVENKIPEVVVEKTLNADLPTPPDFRGAWMFMPWDNYEPSILCNDGRFSDLGDKYTVQFWIKAAQSIQENVTLFSFVSGTQAVESIFLSTRGYLCFNPGQEHSNIALLKPLPFNGRHYHVAVTREGNKCRIFVNGKVKQSFEVDFKDTDKLRDYIVLLKSKSTLKGLAIDELMVSNEILFEENFKPERILTISKSTVLYMPFEKDEQNTFKCYGSKHYNEYTFLGGKWLNVLNEVQQVINHLELLEDTKGPQSNQSVP